jgi:hypothetical protein
VFVLAGLGITMVMMSEMAKGFLAFKGSGPGPGRMTALRMSHSCTVQALLSNVWHICQMHGAQPRGLTQL